MPARPPSDPADPVAEAKGRTQAERTDASRALLVRTTIDLLATEGYRAASASRIQEASNLSRGLVGYHFGSKTRLMKAVVQHIRGTFHEETDPGAREADGLDRIVHFFDAYLTRLGRNSAPARAMLVLATESFSEAPELREAIQEANAQLRGLFAEMVEAGVADGSVREGVDPPAHAAVLEGVLRGIVLQHFIDPAGFDLPRVHAAVLDSVRSDLARG